jgi:hypothetical protein
MVPENKSQISLFSVYDMQGRSEHWQSCLKTRNVRQRKYSQVQGRILNRRLNKAQVIG